MPFVAGLGIFWVLVILAASIFWIWMLIDALVNPRLEGVEKLIWVLVVLFLHFLGAILYFVIGRQQRTV
ncbi:MAG TPA: PLDc N-terminal domain-containing protein [Pirellulales bacterium]|jgi:uncharacterized RDD family membrane protein YckC|nr:PLDc N-terminal domain-containing protein [Pirellulales bacterium]